MRFSNDVQIAYDKMEYTRYRYVSIFYWVVSITFLSSCDSTSTKCHTFMSSSCKDGQDTSWNKNNVGKYLKEWIKSVKFEYKMDEQSSIQSYCKALIMREMPFFSNYAPDAVSRYSMLLGNMLPESYENYNQIFERQPNSLITMRFQGPIWADLNNHQDWIVENSESKITARLSPTSILRNGIYYGILDNTEMKLGL